MAALVEDGITTYRDEATWWPNQLQGPLDRAKEDCRWFAALAKKSQLDELWRKLAPTWEDFCATNLGCSAEFVDAVIAGVQALGEDMPVPLERAARVGRMIAEGKNQTEIGEIEGISQQRVSQITNGTLVKRINESPRIRLNLDTDYVAQTIIDRRGPGYAGDLAKAILATLEGETK